MIDRVYKVESDSIGLKGLLYTNVKYYEKYVHT